MQAVLVIIAVVFSAWYVGRMLYNQFTAKEHDCDQCAVKKLYDQRPR